MNAGLFHIGFAHDRTPLECRERIQRALPDEPSWLDALADLAVERVVLRTCSRFEIYAADAVTDVDTWIERLANASSMPHEDVGRHARVLTGAECARHLFRVSAGVESAIVGEAQVLGQVRSAFATASGRGAIGPRLSVLFRSAIHVGRVVRQSCAARAESYGDVVVDRLRDDIGQVTEPRILIIGSGRIAAEVVGRLTRGMKRTADGNQVPAWRCAREPALMATGNRSLTVAARKDAMGPDAARLGERGFAGTPIVTVANRHADRARRLADSIGASAIGLDNLFGAMARADAILVCTSATGYVVDAALLGDRERPVAVYDLAVPRNVDPAVAVIPGVRLTHLDELLRGRSTADDYVKTATQVVERELSRLEQWWSTHEVQGAAPGRERMVTAMRGTCTKQGMAA